MEGSAGRGAEFRARAQRMLDAADRCDKGDEGERATARLLLDLSKEWVVLHNVFAPGHRWNADHLLIGPGGVIVLDSKNYSGRVQVSKGTLWRGKYPCDYELAAAGKHAKVVGSVLGVDVIPALCIHTAQLPTGHFPVEGMD